MYIFANWKMYLTAAEATALAQDIAVPTSDATVAVFPNTLDFERVHDVVGASIATGAQNVAWTPQGAYTGATSARLFKEAGATYALVGHSERRHVFGESNEDVRKKLEACIDAGLIPVLCIGETKEDLDNDKKEYRLKKQLMKACEGLDGIETLIVAYEPVWAISKGGVGESCSPEQAEKTHLWIKNELKQYTNADIPVIYGGSVKAENVVSFTSLPSVEGVLIGSASTRADSFKAILSAVS